MKRLVASLAALAIALGARASSAQSQPLPPLPPPAPPPPPAATPAPSQPQPLPPPQTPTQTPTQAPPNVITYDATNAPPSTTIVTPAPAPYVVPPEAPDSGARTHDGFYLRMALGPGGVGTRGTAPNGQSTSFGSSGGDLALTLGGTPARGLVLGGMLMFAGMNATTWGDAASPGGGSLTRQWSAGMGAIEAIVDWFPNEHRGWHVGGGLGPAIVVLADKDANTSYGGGALAGRLQGGYDFWLSSQWSLGAQLDFDFTSHAPLNDDNGRDTGYRMGMYGVFLDFVALYH